MRKINKYFCHRLCTYVIYACDWFICDVFPSLFFILFRVEIKKIETKWTTICFGKKTNNNWLRPEFNLALCFETEGFVHFPTTCSATTCFPYSHRGSRTQTESETRGNSTYSSKTEIWIKKHEHLFHGCESWLINKIQEIRDKLDIWYRNIMNYANSNCGIWWIYGQLYWNSSKIVLSVTCVLFWWQFIRKTNLKKVNSISIRYDYI